jgi:hypothetical protein
MTPGAATLPCAGAPSTYPTTASVDLKVLLDLSGKPTR